MSNRMNIIKCDSIINLEAQFVHHPCLQWNWQYGLSFTDFVPGQCQQFLKKKVTYSVAFKV